MGQSLVAICPKCKHKEVYEGTAKRPRIHCEKCKYRYYIQTQKTQKEKVIEKITKSNQKNSSQPPQEKNFIDDPVELLTSSCMRQLNKQDPDARWASILLTLLDKTNKLEYKDIEEAQLQNQLKAKSISELISSKKKLIKL